MYHSEIKGVNFSTNSTLSKWQNWKKQNPYLRYVGLIRRLTKKTDEVISEIQKRNKLIRLADKSAGG